MVSMTLAHSRSSLGSKTTTACPRRSTFEEDEQAPHADVFPERIRGQRSRTPDTDAAPGKVAQDVHAFRVQLVLNAVGDVVLERLRASHDLVGGSLEHAALGVGPAVDAEDVPARRPRRLGFRARRSNCAPLVDADWLGVLALLRVDGCEMEAHVLADRTDPRLAMAH